MSEKHWLLMPKGGPRVPKQPQTTPQNQERIDTETDAEKVSENDQKSSKNEGPETFRIVISPRRRAYFHQIGRSCKPPKESFKNIKKYTNKH